MGKFLGQMAVGFFCGSLSAFANTNVVFNLDEILNPDLTKLFEQKIGAPALWGIQMTGVDLAKAEIEPLKLKPVSVFVSDGGFRSKNPNQQSFKYENHHRPLRLLVSTHPQSDSGSEIVREILMDDWIGYLVANFPKISLFLFGKSNGNHGTHVAGTIGLVPGDFAVSSSANLIDLDVFQGLGVARLPVLLSAYEALAESPEPVDVLNMSHSLGTSPDLTTALRSLVDKKNTVCVVAAHNQGQKISDSLVINHLNDCIIVGSLGRHGFKSDFSNYGAALDLLAPGEDILSLGNGLNFNGTNVVPLSGTSMAAPHVSGVAANLKAILPMAKARDIRALLYKSAIDIGLTGRDDQSGFGVLNALRATRIAIQIAKSTHGSTDEISKKVSDDQSFDLSEASRFALLQANREGSLAINYPRLLRQAALLDGNAESFYQVGQVYEKNGYASFGIGMQIMAVNRPYRPIGASDRFRFAKILAHLQETALKNFAMNVYVIHSIANSDLLLQTAEELSQDSFALLSNAIKDQLKLLAPHRVAEFDERIRERLFSTSTTYRVATPRTAK